MDAVFAEQRKLALECSPGRPDHADATPLATASNCVVRAMIISTRFWPV
jgi:hypothetical protein